MSDPAPRPARVVASVYTSAMQTTTGTDMPLPPASAPAPSGADLAAGIRRVFHLLMCRLNASVDGLDISYAQYESMDLLARDPDIHAAALARHLRVSRQTVHGIVRRLELGGLVRLLPVDSGVRGIALTDTGHQRLEAARDGAEIGLADLDALPEARRARIAEALDECERVLRLGAGWTWLNG